MRAYRDRAPYVRPRFEAAGVILGGITLNGADLTDTRGYADIWHVPADPGQGVVSRARDLFVVPPTVGALLVPRIEPHQNPPWLEPPGGFA